MKKIVANLKSKYHGAKERVIRKSLQSLVSFSTLPASMHLRRVGGMRILIDSSVIAHSVTHETAWISTGPQMWGHVEIDSGYSARIPVHSPSNDSRLQEVRFLAGISILARRKRLKLFTSAELRAEQLRQPVGRFSGYGSFDLGLFKKVSIESIDGEFFDLRDATQKQLNRVASCKDKLYSELVKSLGAKSSLAVCGKTWKLSHCSRF